MVVRGPAGLAGKKQQDSLSLRTLHGNRETLPAGGRYSASSSGQGNPDWDRPRRKRWTDSRVGSRSRPRRARDAGRVCPAGHAVLHNLALVRCHTQQAPGKEQLSIPARTLRMDTGGRRSQCFSCARGAGDCAQAAGLGTSVPGWARYRSCPSASSIQRGPKHQLARSLMRAVTPWLCRERHPPH